MTVGKSFPADAPDGVEGSDCVPLLVRALAVVVAAGVTSVSLDPLLFFVTTVAAVCGLETGLDTRTSSPESEEITNGSL